MNIASPYFESLITLKLNTTRDFIKVKDSDSNTAAVNDARILSWMKQRK